MVLWSKSQAAAHRRGLAAAEKWKESIEKLQELAKHNPAFAGAIQDLADMRDHLETSCRIAVSIDPKGE